MGTAVLRSEDCLRVADRFSSETFLSRSLKSKISPNPNPNPNPNNKHNPNPKAARAGRRKRSQVGCSEKENGVDPCRTKDVNIPVKNRLVMGQVTILKRGDDLKPLKNLYSRSKSEVSVDEKVAKIVNDDESVQCSTDLLGTEPYDEKLVYDEESVLCSTDRLGPEPEKVPKHIRLPDLNFINGRYAGSAFFASPPPSSLPFPAFFTKKDVPKKNDVATTDLRRLLRLDLP